MDEEALFLELVEIRSPAEREARLGAATEGNEALRRNLERLLKLHELTDDFLRASPAAVARTIDMPTVPESPGTVIGPYKLLEQIGEGGFGVVFMAEQTQPLRRKVALKVLKPGMDTKQVVARFEAERQALAIMDHPNIARVFDGGATPSGRPFFVMELVKGVPITEYCDANQLTPRQRLELFVPVCQAVQHAHQKGIIHRDLKPSNVLVTVHDTTPVVKVIDFGVAKALGQELTEKTLFTGFAQMVGTPLYMSPEQAGQSSLDVDTRSDIYSLGVLLYELFTGTTPFGRERFKEASYEEIRRIIREEEPARPSNRISTLGQAASTVSTNRKSDPKRLSQLFSGELDWIVMKCLEKDRNRRYETASALAADAQHYLHDEPVLACPPSAWYRLRKFTRRKKAALLMAACVFLALAGIAGGIGWGVRDRAAREMALDSEVNRALDDATRRVDESHWFEARGVLQRAEQLLEAAGHAGRSARLEKLQKEVAMAQRLEDIYSQPEGAAFWTGHEQDRSYAAAFADYGIDVAVLPTADAAERIRASIIRRELTRALDFWSLMRKFAGTQAPDWKQLLAIAEAADPDPWRNQVREALRHGDRKGLEELAPSVDVRQLPPETLTLLGRTLSFDPASATQGEALLRRAQRQYPGDLWINDTLGVRCFWSQPPQYEDAVRFYSIATALRPRNPYMVHQVGEALRKKGALVESVAMFTKAIELSPNYLDAWLNRGAAYYHLGEYHKAIADSSQAIKLDPNRAVAWCQRALAYIALGRCDEALADSNKAIEVDQNYWWGWDLRALTHNALQQYEEALADYSKSLELNPSVAAWSAVADLSNRLANAGRFEVVEQTLTKALEKSPNRAAALRNRAEFFFRSGLLKEAAADLARAYELEEPENSWGFVLHALLRAYAADGKGYRDASLRMLERFGDWTNPEICCQVAAVLAFTPESVAEPSRAVALGEAAVADNRLVWRVANLGVVYYRAGEFERAKAALEESLAIDANWNPPCVHSALAMVLQRLGNGGEASAALGRARNARDGRIEAMLAGGLGHWPRPWWEVVQGELMYNEAYALIHGSPPPEDPRLAVLRGRALKVIGRADE